MPPKVREVIRRLEREGWRLVDQEGSHRQFKHPRKPGKVTVAGPLNQEMAPGTWNNVQWQAGWKGRKRS